MEFFRLLFVLSQSQGWEHTSYVTGQLVHTTGWAERGPLDGVRRIKTAPSRLSIMGWLCPRTLCSLQDTGPESHRRTGQGEAVRPWPQPLRMQCQGGDGAPAQYRAGRCLGGRQAHGSLQLSTAPRCQVSEFRSSVRVREGGMSWHPEDLFLKLRGAGNPGAAEHTHVHTGSRTRDRYSGEFSLFSVPQREPYEREKIELCFSRII